jgi:hypothetical protein
VGARPTTSSRTRRRRSSRRRPHRAPFRSVSQPLVGSAHRRAEVVALRRKFFPKKWRRKSGPALLAPRRWARPLGSRPYPERDPPRAGPGCRALRPETCESVEGRYSARGTLLAPPRGVSAHRFEGRGRAPVGAGGHRGQSQGAAVVSIAGRVILGVLRPARLRPSGTARGAYCGREPRLRDVAPGSGAS